MPAYYYVAAFANPNKVQIARPEPEQAATAIPNRPCDFPSVPKVPFAEEARVHIIGNLYSEWSYALQLPVLVRANDDGTLDAWLHPEGVAETAAKSG